MNNVKRWLGNPLGGRRGHKGLRDGAFIPVFVLLLPSLGGCGGTAEAQGPETVVGAIVGALSFASTHVNFAEVRGRLDQLEEDMRTLRQTVTDLSWRIEESDRQNRARALTFPMANAKAAMERPNAQEAEWSLYTDGLALQEWTWYSWPGRTQNTADRFDPRGAAPQFVLTVIAWLKIRDHQNFSADDTRSKVPQFANHLTEIAARTRQQVHCEDRCDAGWFPPSNCRVPILSPIPSPLEPGQSLPDECPLRFQCTCMQGCLDRIDGSNTLSIRESPLFEGGTCDSPPPESAVQLKEDLLRSKYSTQFFEETADGWRAR